MTIPEQNDWRWQLSNLIRTPRDLERFLGRPLPGTKGDGMVQKMWVTPYFAGLIDPDDPRDPILMQILPRPEERTARPGSQLDPLDEEGHSPVVGLIHRYPDRVLLTVTGFCPALCRFCMRRRCWSPNAEEIRIDPGEVLSYVGSRKGVRDVILSGGDPLFMPLSHLRNLLEGLKSIDHVEIVRIGSRASATLPMRIDEEVTEMIRDFKPLWMLTHFNHPREITPEAEEALDRMASAGAILNNQSVLLRGINDSAAILTELSKKLLKAGVRPYYLHQLDRVGPASHFHVPIEEGKRMVKTMFGRISGLGIPRYVLDLPGGKGKVPLMPNFTEGESDGCRVFEAPLGGRVRVPKSVPPSEEKR